MGAKLVDIDTGVVANGWCRDGLMAASLGDDEAKMGKVDQLCDTL